jgi:hypothetical protein
LALKSRIFDVFKFDPEGKKKAILEMANSGLRRPSQKTPLGRALDNYLKFPNSAFSIAVKTAAPSWFIPCCTVSSNKAAILAMAAKGEGKPDWHSKLGGAFQRYCIGRGRRRDGYDGKFAEAVRKLSPNWFINPRIIAAGKKASLLEMARRGEARPSRNSSLSWYCIPGRSGYDADFTEELRRLAPSWFINDVVKGKKIFLLEMARQRQVRPKRGQPLAEELLSYTNNSTAFDKDFYEEIRRIAPQWFPRRRKSPTPSGKKRRPPKGTLAGSAA